MYDIDSRDRVVPLDLAPPPDSGDPLPIVLALCFTAAGTLALFFFPDVPLALAQQLVTMP